jgi:hypothetical protein
MPLFSTWYLNFAQAGGFHILINFHEEPLGIIKLGASSREAGQDSGSKEAFIQRNQRLCKQNMRHIFATKTQRHKD